MLQIKVENKTHAWANFFSTLVLFSFTIMAILFQYFMVDAQQGYYFVAVMVISYLSCLAITACIYFCSNPKKSDRWIGRINAFLTPFYFTIKKKEY